MATTPNDAASREALEKYNSDDTQPATARLKKRKAASAYLARQRHKSFVGGLQNETSALESRVVELRSRKGKLFEACGSAMRERMCAALSEERQRQLTQGPSPQALVAAVFDKDPGQSRLLGLVACVRDALDAVQSVTTAPLANTARSVRGAAGDGSIKAGLDGFNQKYGVESLEEAKRRIARFKAAADKEKEHE